MFKNKKGITLVALIVTIIILLILAGVTIAQLTENGLFEKAKKAGKESENAQVNEEGILADYEGKIDEYVNGTRDGIVVDKEEYENMKEKMAELEEQYKTEKERVTSLEEKYENEKIRISTLEKQLTETEWSIIVPGVKYKKKNGYVIVQMNMPQSVTIPAGSTYENKGCVIGTLPSGYRPSSSVLAPITYGGHNKYSGACFIDSDGKICLIGESSGTYVVGNIIFPVD